MCCTLDLLSREKLDRYYAYITSPEIEILPLHLVIEGDTPTFNHLGQLTGYETVLSDAMLGKAASFIHFLRVRTEVAGRIDTIVWTKLHAMKILDIVITSDAAALTRNFFKNATSVESLRLNVGGALLDFDPAIMTQLPSLRCFNLFGTNLKCDCETHVFLQKSPLWKLPEFSVSKN